MIKCVVWDIDNTLLAGTYLESGERPPAPDPELLGIARELDGRGLVHALASKNPPAAADYVASVTGLPFAAVECGWGRKSDAVRRIIDDLGIAADAVAFVDDDLLERAEVAAALPDVLVLSPEDAAEAASWPEFSPAVLTAEGRRRGEMYAQRRRRHEEARAFGGSRDDFLRQVGTQVLIVPAGRADLARLHELSVRTHQFNTAAKPVSEDDLAAQLGAAGHRLIAVRLRDQFGDDGIVGGALIDRGEASTGAAKTRAAIPVGAPPALGARPAAGVPSAAAEGRAWTVTQLMMSCRALGRGVLDALLAWLCQQAAADGAAELRISCLVTERNVPLRLALAAAGFRAAANPDTAPAASAPAAPGSAAPGSAAPARAVPASAAPASAVSPTAVSPTAASPTAATGPAEPVLFTRPLAGPLPALPDWATAADQPATADQPAVAGHSAAGRS